MSEDSAHVETRGAPMKWADLKPYEQQQGGYWEYGLDCDVYGNGKRWVPVTPHKE